MSFLSCHTVQEGLLLCADFPEGYSHELVFILLADARVLNVWRALCTCRPQTRRLTSITHSLRIIRALVQAISVLGSLLLMRGKPHVQIVTFSCGNSMLYIQNITWKNADMSVAVHCN